MGPGIVPISLKQKIIINWGNLRLSTSDIPARLLVSGLLIIIYIQIRNVRKVLSSLECVTKGTQRKRKSNYSLISLNDSYFYLVKMKLGKVVHFKKDFVEKGSLPNQFDKKTTWRKLLCRIWNTYLGFWVQFAAGFTLTVPAKFFLTSFNWSVRRSKNLWHTNQRKGPNLNMALNTNLSRKGLRSMKELMCLKWK